MPWDSRAERERAELGNEAGDTRTSLASDYERAQRELGLGTGEGSPYSVAEELKRQREASRGAALNTAGNQIYAGSTVNKVRGAQRRYDIGYKQLQDQYAQAQTAYNRGVGQVGRDEQLGQSGIQEGALERAVASEPQPLATSGRGRGRGTGGRRKQQRQRRGRGRY